jgi:hypothetical protein
MEILGINPFAGPERITASVILFRKDFICNLIPLNKFDGSLALCALGIMMNW